MTDPTNLSDAELCEAITQASYHMLDAQRPGGPEIREAARRLRELDRLYVTRNRLQEEPVNKRYNELIFGVSKKFPDESRHETALRYIMEAEKRREVDSRTMSDIEPRYSATELKPDAATRGGSDEL